MNNKLSEEISNFVLETMLAHSCKCQYVFDGILKHCPDNQNKFLYLVDTFLKDYQKQLSEEITARNSMLVSLHAQRDNAIQTIQVYSNASVQEQRKHLTSEIAQTTALLSDAINQAKLNKNWGDELLAGMDCTELGNEHICAIADILKDKIIQDENTLAIAIETYEQQLAAIVNPSELTEEQVSILFQNKLNYLKEQLTTIELGIVTESATITKIKNDVDIIENTLNLIKQDK